MSAGEIGLEEDDPGAEFGLQPVNASSMAAVQNSRHMPCPSRIVAALYFLAQGLAGFAAQGLAGAQGFAILPFFMALALSLGIAQGFAFMSFFIEHGLALGAHGLAIPSAALAGNARAAASKVAEARVSNLRDRFCMVLLLRG